MCTPPKTTSTERVKTTYTRGVSLSLRGCSMHALVVCQSRVRGTSSVLTHLTPPRLSSLHAPPISPPPTPPSPPTPWMTRHVLYPPTPSLASAEARRGGERLERPLGGTQLGDALELSSALRVDLVRAGVGVGIEVRIRVE